MGTAIALPPQVSVRASGTGPDLTSIAIGGWSDFLQIDTTAATGTSIRVTPMLFLSGHLDAVGASSFSALNVSIQAFVPQGSTSFQFVPVAYTRTCTPSGLSGLPPQLVTCNDVGTAGGGVPASAVVMPDNVQTRWVFSATVQGQAPLGGGSFDVDLSATIGWLGLDVRDAAGNSLSYTATSGAGVDWSRASVPEPSVVALLALGTAALAAIRRRPH